MTVKTAKPSATTTVLGKRKQGRISRITSTIVDETTNVLEDLGKSLSTSTNLLRNTATEILTDSQSDLLEAKLNFARKHSEVTRELVTLGYTLEGVDDLLSRTNK